MKAAHNGFGIKWPNDHFLQNSRIFFRKKLKNYLYFQIFDFLRILPEKITKWHELPGAWFFGDDSDLLGDGCEILGDGVDLLGDGGDLLGDGGVIKFFEWIFLPEILNELLNEKMCDIHKKGIINCEQISPKNGVLGFFGQWSSVALALIHFLP